MYTPPEWGEKAVKGRGIYSVDSTVIKTSIQVQLVLYPRFLDKSSYGLDFLGCHEFVCFISVPIARDK